jgi:hypothetical protein
MLNGENVRISQNSKIAECLGQGGAAVARVMLGCWHYVLLTGIDDQYVYLFDPYYRIKSFPNKDIQIIKEVLGGDVSLARLVRIQEAQQVARRKQHRME